LELNNTIEKMDLTNLYTILHSTVPEQTLFSTVHVTFSKIGHMLGHKAYAKN
jgi:hypothetical protein